MIRLPGLRDGPQRAGAGRSATGLSGLEDALTQVEVTSTCVSVFTSVETANAQRPPAGKATGCSCWGPTHGDEASVVKNSLTEKLELAAEGMKVTERDSPEDTLTLTVRKLAADDLPLRRRLQVVGGTFADQGGDQFWVRVGECSGEDPLQEDVEMVSVNGTTLRDADKTRVEQKLRLCFAHKQDSPGLAEELVLTFRFHPRCEAISSTDGEESEC